MIFFLPALGYTCPIYSMAPTETAALPCIFVVVINLVYDFLTQTREWYYLLPLHQINLNMIYTLPGLEDAENFLRYVWNEGERWLITSTPLTILLLACVLSCFSSVWLRNPMDCGLPGFSVHGILQARILEWVAMPSSRGSSWPRIEPAFLTSPALVGLFFTTSATWETPGDPFRSYKVLNWWCLWDNLSETHAHHLFSQWEELPLCYHVRVASMLTHFTCFTCKTHLIYFAVFSEPPPAGGRNCADLWTHTSDCSVCFWVRSPRHQHCLSYYCCTEPGRVKWTEQNWQTTLKDSYFNVPDKAVFV